MTGLLTVAAVMVAIYAFILWEEHRPAAVAARRATYADDVVAVAKTVGVLVDTNVDEPIPYVPTQMAQPVRLDVFDDAEFIEMLAAWSRDAAAVALVDHAPCEGGDCEAIICCCPDSVIGQPCPGTEMQGCLHHSLLCDECRAECVDCRIDAAEDAS